MKGVIRNKEVSRCWYPEPPIALLEIGNNIMVRVLDGEPAYQMSSGEVIEVRPINAYHEGADL